MSVPKKDRTELFIDTRDQAKALLEDFDYLRAMLKRPEITRGEVRTLSVILRRHLLESAITTIANPRIGRFHFSVPDYNQLIKSQDDSVRKHLPQAGKLVAHRCWVGGAAPFPWELRSGPVDKSSTTWVDVRIDGFLSQRVLCYNDLWIKRKNVIEYVANFASGVHYSPAKPKAEIEAALDILRKQSKITKTGISVPANSSEPGEKDWLTYNDDEMNLVLYQLFAAVYFIVHSNDTQRLEQFVRDCG